MYKKKPYKIIIFALLIVIIVALCIFTPVAKILSSWVGNIVTPVQSGIANVVTSTKEVLTKWENTQKLAEENKALKSQIDEFKKNNRDYLKFKTENQRLKELLDLKDELDTLNPIAASVITKDSGNWFNVFTVNAGKNKGAIVNTPVVNSKGLIGRVSQIGENWSKVVTVIDYDHSVSGTILRTGDLVQIDGDISLMKSGLCKMTIITEGADVIIGDTVVTSGIGGIYPKGLFIGTVTEFRNNSEGTGKYAVVKPDVDFQHIFDVLLLTNAEE
ncbi:MAG: rod shape-determining protein MreC [Clostridia bacterium]|nr:rod shape-determining protein MreC [Clostridia bacterium]